jgi:F0F1-type ATP synthase assembly protein I
MINDKKPLNGEPWWKPAMGLFSEVSMWIVAPIIIALIVGKSLDSHYHTKPTLFLISTGIAFLFTCIGMVRVVQKYIKKIKEIEDKTKK